MRVPEKTDTTLPVPTLAAAPTRPPETTIGVLIVSPHEGTIRRLSRALTRTDLRIVGVRSVSEAAEALDGAGLPDVEASRIHVVVADSELSDADAAATVRSLLPACAGAGARLVLAVRRPSLGSAMEAIRAGATDVVAFSACAELADRSAAAGRAAIHDLRQRERILRLRGMCRRLNTAREQVARQVDALCTDLVLAYQEIAEHMSQVTTASEFKGLIRNELDIESLLRTTLEYVLGRSGPTNAAIFLPTTSGDYSLGAYVNYDCPKDTVDILLDHLANVVAPRFESLDGLLYMPEQDGLDRYIGDDAHWLDSSGVVALACRHNHETLAIFMLFRDRRNTYSTGLLEQIKTIGELFASQLARVIHIHHRHLPKDKWGMLGDPEHGADDGYGDLAA